MVDAGMIWILFRSICFKVSIAFAIGLILFPMGCERRPNPESKSTAVEEIDDPSQPPQLPPPVLSIAPPPPLSPVVGGKDVSKEKPALLHMQAYSYAGKGSFSEAAQCQSWVVKRTDEG